MDSNSQPLFLAIATKPTELLNSVNYLLLFSMQLLKQKEKQLDSDETKRNLLAKKKILENHVNERI
jgi:hypothetical protein